MTRPALRLEGARRPIGRAWVAAVVAILLAAGPAGGEAGRFEEALQAGEAALRRGALEEAGARFQEAARGAARAGRTADAGAALLRLGETQQALGRHQDAIASLQRALALLEGAADQRQRASVLGALGNAYAAFALPSDGRRPGEEARPTHEKARSTLEEAVALAQKADAAEVAAPILVNLGNHLASTGELGAARARYREAAEAAGAAGLSRVEAKALANAARAALAQADVEGAVEAAEAALGKATALPDSHEKAFLLVNLGSTYGSLAQQRSERKRELLVRAHEALTLAATTAAGIGDRRTESYAWGTLGSLYEEQNRSAEAFDLTRRALFAAQQADAPESLYRWQWQAGRLLAAQGEIGAAVQAYGGAVETLQEIRSELSLGYRGEGSVFQDVLVPVYYGRVDMLLQAARGTADAKQRQALLEEARSTVELLKADELRDYFRDECVLQVRESEEPIDRLPAIIVYPMILDDRTEFIVSIGGELRHFSAQVGREELTREVRLLRGLLEKRTTHQYLPHAKKLYDWLVRPYEEALEASKHKTIVFVPDGPLRTIPIAALHDGSRFLIDRYAVATTPGLSLIEPRPLDRGELKALVSGVSEAVQGFAPLEYVPQELAAVGGLYRSKVLLDADFNDRQVRSELEDHTLNIVHIASHGQFEANFEDTFLLTYDGKLTMDELEDAVGMFRFREKPLELLTLSACETAAGDERAALGLAGVAVKAGARSVLATLWTVSDRAASELVTDFYAQLREPSVSRAVALQRAQSKLIEDPVWRHPAYWSAFLLISNWL